MENIPLAAYQPDFTPHNWSLRDRHFLEPFVTNPDGFVSVLRNLPPEIAGALCSRASRASGSLLEVFLKEYVYPIVDGEDKALAGELENSVLFLKDHGFKNILNNQRAQAFYAKWLAQFGDDSIAQMTGTHAIFWGISQVAMKFAEDQRIGLEPLEKSTRYVQFGNKVGGRYLYYIPGPDLERLGLLAEYSETLNRLFETYVSLQQPLIAWFKANFAEKDPVLEKKAFDTLRGLLPMATLGQVAFRGNAQAFEYLINRTAKHPLGEFRWISAALKTELDKEIPSLLLRVDDPRTGEYQEYLASRAEHVQKFIRSSKMERESPPISRETKPAVRLVEFDPEAEIKICAAILFPAGHLSWEDNMRMVSALPPEKRKELLRTYLRGRTERWQKVGRAFESSYLRFEITMNVGAYRDLHRHRMATQERQLFSCHHGYDVPEEIIEAGLDAQFREALDRAGELFLKIKKHDPELAQYVVPLAYRMRFYQWQNFRQIFWEGELRTTPQGHPDYRRIEQEKYGLVREKFPLIAELMLVDMADYPFARRGTEEAIKQKEAKIIKGLGKQAP